jgi:CubicO group peptidase (beta-lactamase class C family)
MNEAAQKQVQGVIEKAIADGSERGIQLAAYHNGKLVVDIAAGWADNAQTRPLQRDTPVPFFSVTKGLTSTLVHILIERRQLSYETRIADVWPEFGVNGKESITVGQALAHKAGLTLVPGGVTLEQIHDFDFIVRKLAASTPVWPPGSRVVYHPVTHGWLLGEVMRRVDGRPFQQMLREEICQPLGVTNLYCGIPDSVAGRVAELDEIFPPEREPLPKDEQAARDVPVNMLPLFEWMNKPSAQRACLPASSGIGDARSLAKHYAALHRNGVDGVRLLAPETIDNATQQQFPDDPSVVDKPRIAFGWHVGGEGPMGPRKSSFGHGGYGGSIGFLDREVGLAVGFTKTLFSPRGAGEAILRSLYEALGIPRYPAPDVAAATK